MSERIIYITKEPYDYRLCICTWKVSETKKWTNFLPEVLRNLAEAEYGKNMESMHRISYLAALNHGSHIFFKEQGKIFRVTYHCDERSIRGLHPFDCLFVGPSNREELFQHTQEFLLTKSLGDLCD